MDDKAAGIVCIIIMLIMAGIIIYGYIPNVEKGDPLWPGDTIVCTGMTDFKVDAFDDLKLTSGNNQMTCFAIDDNDYITYLVKPELKENNESK